MPGRTIVLGSVTLLAVAGVCGLLHSAPTGPTGSASTSPIESDWPVSSAHWDTFARVPVNTPNLGTVVASGTTLEPQRTVGLLDIGIEYPRPVACFAEGTDPDVVERWNDWLWSQVPPTAYFIGTRWSGGNYGDPKELTWSFVPDGLWIPSAGGDDDEGYSELFSRMDSLFGGNRALWISKFQAIFDRWEELTGLTYTRIIYDQEWDDGATWRTSDGSSSRGMIRIAMRNIDGSNGTLGYNYYPQIGDMLLDSSENWGSSSYNYRFLRNVTAHEHGHGIGLAHVCPNSGTKLMEPYMSTSHDGPQHDDIRAGQRSYGDPYEHDNTSGTAGDLGTVEIGSPLVRGPVPGTSVDYGSVLSIDRDGEQDYFRFTISGPRFITVEVDPIGLQYWDEAEPPGPGPCCTGGACDDTWSNYQANLNAAIYDTDGTTQLAVGDSAATGQTEIVETNLSEAGDYYVKVYEGSSPDQTQLYWITVTAGEEQPCFGVDCDNGLWCDGEEYCDDGDCYSGTEPCTDPHEVCDEDSDSCVPCPGACCYADGTCGQAVESACIFDNGSHHYGDGVLCSDEPLDPECLPVATQISIEANTSVALAGGSVSVEVFIEQVEDMTSYQADLEITRISGTGDLTLDCSECPGENCGARIDINRSDFVFHELYCFAFSNCSMSRIGSALLYDTASVGSTPAYLGEYTLDVSPDATEGTVFEVALVPDSNKTFLRTTNGLPIPTRIGASVTVTVLPPGTCLEPTVIGDSCRYLRVTPNGLASQAILVSGDPANPDIACVSKYVQEDGTLGDTPVFLTPEEWDGLWNGPISVHGEEIIPSVMAPGPVSTYLVQAQCGVEFSSEVSASTWAWGEVYPPPNGMVDIDDILASIRVFQSDFSVASLEQADLYPCVPDATVTGSVDIDDILAVIWGFQSIPYPCDMPCP